MDGIQTYGDGSILNVSGYLQLVESLQHKLRFIDEWELKSNRLEFVESL